MNVQENHEIIIEKCPFFEEINEKLLEEVDNIEYPLTNVTNVKAKCSDWYTKSENIKKIHSWILYTIKMKYSQISQHLTFPSMGKLETTNTWFSRYGQGDYTIPHDHIPSTFSWSLFVKCPKGSSPLVFPTSGKRIKAEEGKAVIFPGNILHEVPKNNCDDRIVLAGNFTFVLTSNYYNYRDG